MKVHLPAYLTRLNKRPTQSASSCPCYQELSKFQHLNHMTNFMILDNFKIMRPFSLRLRLHNVLMQERHVLCTLSLVSSIHTNTSESGNNIWFSTDQT